MQTNLSRRAFLSSCVFLFFLPSGERLLSREASRLLLGGVADLDGDLEMERSLRRADLRPLADGVTELSLSLVRRGGGVALASDLLRRRGGVGDLDLDLDRDIDLPLALTGLLSLPSK